MMKKSIFKHTFSALLVLLTIQGCESDKEFLREEPITFYTVENAFSTSAQIDQVLVSMYSQLRDLWANPTERGWIFVWRGNGTDMYDVPSIRRGNKIGRASCRERVCQYVKISLVAVTLKKKKQKKEPDILRN